MAEFKISFQVDGQTFEGNSLEGNTILDVALRSRVPAPYSCLEGVCQSCKARLVSGTVRGETLEDVKGRACVLTCQSIPTSDLQVSYDLNEG